MIITDANNEENVNTLDTRMKELLHVKSVHVCIMILISLMMD